jgi:hypothetical protein
MMYWWVLGFFIQISQVDPLVRIPCIKWRLSWVSCSIFTKVLVVQLTTLEVPRSRCDLFNYFYIKK